MPLLLIFIVIPCYYYSSGQMLQHLASLNEDIVLLEL